MIRLCAVLALFWASGAVAQSNCAQRDRVVERLTEKYGERFSGGGLRNESIIYEVWHSKEKGTWTILMTRADGVSCIIASGTNWREAMPEGPAGIPG